MGYYDVIFVFVVTCRPFIMAAGGAMLTASLAAIVLDALTLLRK
jgi:hypothetical protein